MQQRSEFLPLARPVVVTQRFCPEETEQLIGQLLSFFVYRLTCMHLPFGYLCFDLLCSSDRICDISLLKLVSSADVCRVLTKVHLVCTASRGHKHKIPSRPTSRRHSPAIKAERARGALSSGCLCYLCVDFPSRVCNV